MIYAPDCPPEPEKQAAANGTDVKLLSSSGAIDKKGSSIIQVGRCFVAKDIRKRSIFFAVIASVFLCTAGTAVCAMEKDSAGASAVVLVHASPKTVWRAVHEERYHDPDIASVRVLEKSGNDMMLEETFQSVPILGSVTAVLEQHEVPYGRIDYLMVKSDKFKSMRGSWSLTPVGNGRETLLKLTSFIDVGIPFSGVFLHNATQQKLNRRLSNVKQLAEREQTHMAASDEQPL